MGAGLWSGVRREKRKKLLESHPGRAAHAVVLNGEWAHEMDEMKHPKNALMPGLKSPGTQAHPLSVSFADSSPLPGASLKNLLMYRKQTYSLSDPLTGPRRDVGSPYGPILAPENVTTGTFSSPARGEPWTLLNFC